MKYPTIEEAKAYIPVVEGMIGKESFVQVAPEDLVNLLKAFVAHQERGESITIWKEGNYRIWRKGDAVYAENDPDWLLTIHLDELPEIKKELDKRNDAISQEPYVDEQFREGGQFGMGA